MFNVQATNSEQELREPDSGHHEAYIGLGDVAQANNGVLSLTLAAIAWHKV
jgi:hypothetical protein